MRKRDELTDPNSCLSKAAPDEMLFVLRAKDADAPATIRYWAALRIRSGKNKAGDPKLDDAFACAEEMERQRLAMESTP